MKKKKVKIDWLVFFTWTLVFTITAFYGKWLIGLAIDFLWKPNF